MRKDVDSWLQDFSDIVCTEPRLTDWVESSIYTGEATPIS